MGMGQGDSTVNQKQKRGQFWQWKEELFNCAEADLPSQNQLCFTELLEWMVSLHFFFFVTHWLFFFP